MNKQLTASNELTIEYPESEDNSALHGDSRIFFLEYESDSDVGGDCIATLYRI